PSSSGKQPPPRTQWGNPQAAAPDRGGDGRRRLGGQTPSIRSNQSRVQLPPAGKARMSSEGSCAARGNPNPHTPLTADKSATLRRHSAQHEYLLDAEAHIPPEVTPLSA